MCVCVANLLPIFSEQILVQFLVCFTGMTMVKLGKGEENNPVDFINKRRAALERY